MSVVYCVDTVVIVMNISTLYVAAYYLETKDNFQLHSSIQQRLKILNFLIIAWIISSSNIFLTLLVVSDI